MAGDPSGGIATTRTRFKTSNEVSHLDCGAAFGVLCGAPGNCAVRGGRCGRTLCTAARRHHEHIAAAPSEALFRRLGPELGTRRFRTSPAQGRLSEAALLYSGIPATNHHAGD